jgi:hypothetical protein
VCCHAFFEPSPAVKDSHVLVRSRLAFVAQAIQLGLAREMYRKNSPLNETVNECQRKIENRAFPEQSQTGRRPLEIAGQSHESLLPKQAPLGL